MPVIFHLEQISLLFQVLHYPAAAFITLHTLIRPGIFIHKGIIIYNRHLLQIMAQTHFKIIGVMSRSNLDCSGAEFTFYISIGENGNYPVNQRQNHLFPYQVGITLIIRMNRHSRIPQHGFRAGGGHYQKLVGIGNRIFDMPEMTVTIFMLHLNIRNGRMTAGTPVDYVVPLINQALFIKVDKYFPHRPGTPFVHGKTLPAPVAGGTHQTQLAGDTVAIKMFPFPYPFQELFPPQIIFAKSLGRKGFLHPCLGGNTGMVGAGQPQAVIALHSPPAGQYILQGIVQSVAQMERTGNIGRRHNYGKRFFTAVVPGGKIIILFPVFIPFSFNTAGIINTG